MALERYDPDQAPEPKAWLATSEAERLRLITRHHVAYCKAQKNLPMHAIAHHGVETWLATGFGPAHRALDALMRRGLSRHDALHYIDKATRALRAAPSDQQAALSAMLDQLARAP